MNINTFIKKIENEYYPQKLDKDYDGNCPCSHFEGKIEGKKFGFHTRCWRVSNNAQDLYIWGELGKKDLYKIGKALKRQLDKQKWYNSYTIIYENLNNQSLMEEKG